MTCTPNGNCNPGCDKDYHDWYDPDDEKWKRIWYCECEDNNDGNLPWPGGDGCHIYGITTPSNTPLDVDCTNDSECASEQICYETSQDIYDRVCDCSIGGG